MWEKIAEMDRKKPIKTEKPKAGSGYYSITFYREDEEAVEAKRLRGRTLAGVQAVKEAG